MSIPPLPGEDHRCAGCGTDYGTLGVDDARGRLARLPDDVAAAVAGHSPERLAARPDPDTWSAVEYVCHLRDVCTTHTIRLHRIRTEDRPSLEPMLNDLRARRFRYAEEDVPAVLRQLRAGTLGLLDEVGRVTDDGWARTAFRLPGEERSARWMLRNAAHEAVHHLADLATVLA